MPEHPVGQTTARVAVLPARVAYLIAAGSRDGFRRAAREASTRWAGMTELIVPVTSRGLVDAAWKQMIETGQIDCVVNVDARGDAADSAAVVLDLPLIPLRRIDHAGPSRWSIHPANVAVATEPQQTVVMATGEKAALWEIAAAGDLDSEHNRDSTGHGFARRPRTADEVGRAQLVSATVLARGLHQFGEHHATNGPFPAPTVVWVTTPNSLKDCIWFWNCRALRSLTFDPFPMYLLPHGGLQHWVGFGEQLRSTLARTEDIEPDVFVCSLSVNNSRLDAIAGRLGLKQSSKKPRARRVFPGPPARTPPYTYKLNIDPRDFVLFGRTYGRTAETVLQTGTARPMLTVDSPVRFTGPGHALLRISSPAFDHLPRRPKTAKLVMQDADWAGPDLQLASDARSRYRFELTIPTIEDATWALLHEAAPKAQLSDKGRLAGRLRERSTVELVLEPAVLDVIGHLTTPRSKELLREVTRLRSVGHVDADLAEIAATWGGRTQRRYRAAVDLRGSIGEPASGAAEILADQNWADRGLEIKCGQCSIHSFVPLRDVAAPATCPACHAEGSYERSPDLRIYYRLNGLVDRASDQGVLPHLMAAAALRAHDSNTYVLMGVDVAWPDGTSAEVDLFGVHGGKVVAGEAKSSPNEFDIAQVRRDVAMSMRLQADCHVLVSPRSIPEATIQQTGELSTASGMELVVVEGSSVKFVS